MVFLLKLDCQHLICPDCLPIKLEKSENCVICNKKINKVLVFQGNSIYITNILENQIIHCRNKNLGCEWIGKISIYSISHLECPKDVLVCTNIDCNVILARDEIDEHKKICIFREIPCEKCEKIIIFNESKIHSNFCLKEKTPCPNLCGNLIVREDTQNHLENFCDYKLIACDFSQLGCEHVFKKKDYEEHFREFIEFHTKKVLDFLTETFSNINATLENLDNYCFAVENKKKYYEEVLEKVKHNYEIFTKKLEEQKVEDSKENSSIQNLIKENNTYKKDDNNTTTKNLNSIPNSNLININGSIQGSQKETININININQNNNNNILNYSKSKNDLNEIISNEDQQEKEKCNTLNVLSNVKAKEEEKDKNILLGKKLKNSKPKIPIEKRLSDYEKFFEENKILKASDFRKNKQGHTQSQIRTIDENVNERYQDLKEIIESNKEKTKNNSIIKSESKNTEVSKNDELELESDEKIHGNNKSTSSICNSSSSKNIKRIKNIKSIKPDDAENIEKNKQSKSSINNSSMNNSINKTLDNSKKTNTFINNNVSNSNFNSRKKTNLLDIHNATFNKDIKQNSTTIVNKNNSNSSSKTTNITNNKININSKTRNFGNNIQTSIGSKGNEEEDPFKYLKIVNNIFIHSQQLLFENDILIADDFSSKDHLFFLIDDKEFSDKSKIKLKILNPPNSFAFGFCIKELVFNSGLIFNETEVNHGYFVISSDAYLFHNNSSFMNNIKLRNFPPLNQNDEILIQYIAQKDEMGVRINNKLDFKINKVFKLHNSQTIIPCIIFQNKGEKIKLEYSKN